MDVFKIKVIQCSIQTINVPCLCMTRGGITACFDSSTLFAMLLFSPHWTARLSVSWAACVMRAFDLLPIHLQRNTRSTQSTYTTNTHTTTMAETVPNFKLVLVGDGGTGELGMDGMDASWQRCRWLTFVWE